MKFAGIIAVASVILLCLVVLYLKFIRTPNTPINVRKEKFVPERNFREGTAQIFIGNKFEPKSYFDHQ